MNDADSIANDALFPGQTALLAQQGRADHLKPKGACWYCNAPLDNVRRFCNKTCAQDYQMEEEAFR